MVISLEHIERAPAAAELSPALAEKYAAVQESIRQMRRVVVAFSGGVDSTLIAKIAHDLLGSQMLAVTAISESLAEAEREDALRLLAELGIPYELVHTQEVLDPDYAANPANRCYFCKVHVNDALLDVAEARGFEYILDGFNADDTGDHRPGRKAGRERGIRSPLFEAGLNKADVRTLARYLGLRNWNKPALACLSSRVAYGHPITPGILRQIDRAEAALRARGFAELRVRHHENMARIEVPAREFSAVLDARDGIVADLKAAGYVYVTLDLQGFRSGSSNEALTHHD